MLPLTEKEQAERLRHEAEDAARTLDKTVPGGLYINDAGLYVNAEGQYVDEHGKYVDEPVTAQDVQKRMAAAAAARIQAETEARAAEAERRAQTDRRAAELAQQQAKQTQAEADQLSKPPAKTQRG